MSLKKIRREFRDLNFEFTIHALEEMDEDNLSLEDVRWAILHGAINAQLTDDPRGVRFVVRGPVKDYKREIDVVCRFLPSGLLRIITMYQIDK
jgi:hypothetical protein